VSSGLSGVACSAGHPARDRRRVSRDEQYRAGRTLEDLRGRLAEIQLSGGARSYTHDQQVVLPGQDFLQHRRAPRARGADLAADGNAVATAELERLMDGRLGRVTRRERAVEALAPGQEKTPADGNIQR